MVACLKDCSLVESKGPVAEAAPEGDDSPDAPESSVMFVGPLEHMLMRTIAEGSVGGEFAVAELVIA